MSDLVAQLKSMPWYADPASIAFTPRAPTMLALHEAQMLRWIAANAYTGRGDIADLGCFLGGSTCAFGDGVAALGRAFDRRPIQTYDMLVTPNDPFDGYANGLIGADKKPGESFLDRFQDYTAPYAEFIEVHAGDVREHKPPRPIEVLFVDIAKGADINDHLVRHFFGNTIGAGAIVLHQDYNHPWLPWVHITANQLRPFSDFVGDVAGTRIFVQHSRPTDEALQRCLSHASSYEEKIVILENERDINESRYAAAMVQMSSAWLAFLEQGPEAFEARLNHPLMQEEYIPIQVERMRKSAHDYFRGARAGYEKYQREYFQIK